MSYDDARAEREFRQNPPSSAPGQGDDDDWGDLFPEGSSSAEPLSSLYSDDSSDINNTLNNSNNVNNIPSNNMNAQVNTSTEDKIIGICVTAFKGFFTFCKELFISIRNNSSADNHDLGIRICIVSIVAVALGILFSVVEHFTQRGNSPIDLIIGGLLSEMVGVMLCMNFSKGDTSIVQQEPQQQSPTNDFDDIEDISDSDYSLSFEEEDELESFEESDEEDIWDSFLEDSEDEDSYSILASESSVDSQDFSLEDAISNVAEIQQGTQTRQYLFETFCKVLPLVTPDFANMKEITTDEDTFFVFEDFLRSSAIQVGTKEENIPELLELYENPFIYKLHCSRPPGIKEQLIADEIAKAFAWNGGQDKKNGVYAKVETIPGLFVVSIFKGFTIDPISQRQVGGVSISLGDIYKEISQFVCNPSVEFPFVWGVNEKGKAIYCDMKDNNTIIISGMPRGGKSWKGQSVVAQLAMFHSPKEVQFYILDNKNTASDYRYLSTVLPHVKYFCGDYDKINDSLEKIIKMMENTNGKILEESGGESGKNDINIKDYNKKHPDNKLPYVYVVIDELQALMNHFEESNQKEEANRFRGYLSTMTSKLPYLGLRFIMFPHRIVNQIISKDAYTLVSSRVVVNQLDGKEVENAVGISEAKFGYKLAQTGDMAIRLAEVNGGEPCFCHAEMLSSSNESNQNLFDYIGAIWKRLEPDCDCITINGAIGGSISSLGNSKVNKAKPTRDNTEGQETFKYEGFNQGSSIEELEKELGEEVPEVDESFWDEFNID